MNINVNSSMGEEEEEGLSSGVMAEGGGGGGLKSPPVVVDWKKQREDELGFLQKRQLTTKSNLRPTGSIPVPMNEWHQQMKSQKKELRTREQDATQYLHSFRTVVDESPSLVPSTLKDDTNNNNKFSHPPPTMYPPPPPPSIMTEEDKLIHVTPSPPTIQTSIQDKEPIHSLSEQPPPLNPSAAAVAAVVVVDEDDYSFVKVTSQESEVVGINSNYVVLPTETAHTSSTSTTPEPGNNYNSLPDPLELNTTVTAAAAAVVTTTDPTPVVSNDFITNSNIITTSTSSNNNDNVNVDTVSTQLEDMDGVLVDTVLVTENDCHLTAATTTVVQEQDKALEEHVTIVENVPSDKVAPSPMMNNDDNFDAAMTTTTTTTTTTIMEKVPASTMINSIKDDEVPTSNDKAEPLEETTFMNIIQSDETVTTSEELIVPTSNPKESLEEKEKSTILQDETESKNVTTAELLTQPIVPSSLPEKEQTESTLPNPESTTIEMKSLEESKQMNDYENNSPLQPVNNRNTIIRVQFSFGYTTSSPMQHTQSSVEQLVSSFFHPPILENNNDLNNNWVLHYPKHTCQVSIQNVLSTRPNTYKHNVTVLVAIPIEMNDYNFQQHIQDATELIIAQIKSQMTQISV